MPAHAKHIHACTHACLSPRPPIPTWGPPPKKAPTRPPTLPDTQAGTHTLSRAHVTAHAQAHPQTHTRARVHSLRAFGKKRPPPPGRTCPGARASASRSFGSEILAQETAERLSRWPPRHRPAEPTLYDSPEIFPCAFHSLFTSLLAPSPLPFLAQPSPLLWEDSILDIVRFFRANTKKNFMILLLVDSFGESICCCQDEIRFERKLYARNYNFMKVKNKTKQKREPHFPDARHRVLTSGRTSGDNGVTAGIFITIPRRHREKGERVRWEGGGGVMWSPLLDLRFRQR